MRNNLSKYLDKVADGEELVVTERGRAIARVLPVHADRAIDRLIAEGVVVPAARRERSGSRPVKSNGRVSDLVVDQRR